MSGSGKDPNPGEHAKLTVPDHVAEQLRCDLCRAFLSVPPITTFEGKTACGRCRTGWPRNFAYERLAQLATFPCTYCGERRSWETAASHEERCRRGATLCPPALGMGPGQVHPECQRRALTCPFDGCDTRCRAGDVGEHFGRFHKGYIFSNNVVSARKILKEEKVWNFSSDNQVCLVLFRQMPFLLFVHSDCNYDETTGDIISYDYHFGLFTFCKKPCDVKYTASITLQSVADNSHFAMKNQEVKPFNERLHLINFIRIGLVKHESFNFLTTRFKDLKRSDDLILTYTVKIQDTAKPAPDRHLREPLLKMGSLSKHLECPICKEYMCAPVYNCDLGHSVCKMCKSKMAICPFCKAFIGNSRNFILEDILETMMVSCQNEEKGCQFKGGVKEVRLHGLMCAFNV